MQGDAGDFDDNSLVKLHCLPMPAGRRRPRGERGVCADFQRNQ